MEDINTTTQVGNLVKDAELKYTNSGSAVTNLTIAVNRSRKQGDEWVEEASFLDVTIFGRRGEALNQYLSKGTKIGVTGFLKQERWEDRQSGDKRSKVIIIANSIQLLGGNQGNQGNNQPNNSYNNNSRPSGGQQKANYQNNNQYPSNNGQGNNSYNNYPSGGGNGNFEDDIPF